MILGIGLIIMGFTNYAPLAIVAIVIGGGFGLGRKPAFSSYFNKHIKSSSERATVLSSLSMFKTFVIAIANLGIGYALGLSIDYTLAFLGLFTIIFAALFRIQENYLLD